MKQSISKHLNQLCHIATIITLATCSLSMQLKADDTDTPADKQDNPPPMTRSGKRIISSDSDGTVMINSSEANREGKNYYILVEPFSLAPIGSYGVTGGYYVRPSTIIDASYTHGSYDLTIFKSTVDTVGLRYKMFQSNSFYWRAGALYRRYQMTTNIGAMYPVTNDASSKITSFGADFAVGNQWQWDKFTIGCDWVGFFVPITSSSSVNRTPSMTDADYDTATSDAAKIGKSVAPELLRFYLGVSL